MIQYVRNFQKFRPLLGELVMRDVKIKYRKSVTFACDSAFIISNALNIPLFAASKVFVKGL